MDNLPAAVTHDSDRRATGGGGWAQLDLQAGPGLSWRHVATKSLALQPASRRASGCTPCVAPWWRRARRAPPGCCWRSLQPLLEPLLALTARHRRRGRSAPCCRSSAPCGLSLSCHRALVARPRLSRLPCHPAGPHRSLRAAGLPQQAAAMQGPEQRVRWHARGPAAAAGLHPGAGGKHRAAAGLAMTCMLHSRMHAASLADMRAASPGMHAATSACMLHS